jgi:RimJ/RimL family protein N-acetyltransferase
MSVINELTPKKTLRGSKNMLRFTGVSQEMLDKAQGAFIPISHLGPEHRSQILQHLCELSPRDRYLRFGYTTNDSQIDQYVAGLNFDRDEIYGVFNADLQIIAMAHLALMKEEGPAYSAEFGVSVTAHARGRGYGAKLFQRAVIHARNEKVYQMYIHALSENAPMISIARKCGAKIERDGCETEAFLSLSERNLDSRISEFVADQYAKTNYSIKEDAKRFWSFLAQVQEIRTGVRNARHQAAE